MKKNALMLLLLLINLAGYAQSLKICFDYDAAGNQVKRQLIFGGHNKMANPKPKEISEIKNEDLLKFYPEDVISYYPNPVNEELYLKWELIKDNKVSSIAVFSNSGQMVNAIKNTDKLESQVLSFKELPAGIYYVNLYYTDGNQKSIKILKN